MSQSTLGATDEEIRKAYPPDILSFSFPQAMNRLPYSKDYSGCDYAVVSVPLDKFNATAANMSKAPGMIRCAYACNTYNPDLSAYTPDAKAIDYGDVKMNGQWDFARAKSEIAGELSAIINSGTIPLILGGDQTVTLFGLEAASKRYGSAALLHFDSRSDIKDRITHSDKPNNLNAIGQALESGLIDRAHSIQVGLREDEAETEGMEYIRSKELHEKGINSAAEHIRRVIGDKPVYISFDLGFFSPAYAPGVALPASGGVRSWVGLELLRESGIGLNIIGMDVVEFCPDRDFAEMTQITASSIVFEYLGLLVCKKTGNTRYKNFGI